MQNTRESSVLFSLAELHRMEDERQAEERQVAEAEAAHASELEAAAREVELATKREAVRVSARLQELERQILLSEGDRQELELSRQEMERELENLKERVQVAERESLSLESTVEFPKSLSRSSHLWWAGALVAACAGVFLIVGGNEDHERYAPKEGAVASSPLPASPTEVVSSAQACVKETSEISPALPLAKPTLGPKNPATTKPSKRVKPKGTVRPPRPERIPTDCIGSTDPLCGLDD